MSWLQQLSSTEFLQTALCKCKSLRQDQILRQQDAPALLTNSRKKGKGSCPGFWNQDNSEVNSKVKVTIYRIFAHLLLCMLCFSPGRITFSVICTSLVLLMNVTAWKPFTQQWQESRGMAKGRCGLLEQGQDGGEEPVLWQQQRVCGHQPCAKFSVRANKAGAEKHWLQLQEL